MNVFECETGSWTNNTHHVLCAVYGMFHSKIELRALVRMNRYLFCMLLLWWNRSDGEHDDWTTKIGFWCKKKNTHASVLVFSYDIIVVFFSRLSLYSISTAVNVERFLNSGTQCEGIELKKTQQFFFSIFFLFIQTVYVI